MKRIRVTGRGQPLIRDVGPGQPKVDPLLVAKALGAEIVSTGGRPGLAWATRRQKIPLSEADWNVLVRIAESASTEKRKVYPAQVAGMMLHEALVDRGPTEGQIEKWLYDNHPGRMFDEAAEGNR